MSTAVELAYIGLEVPNPDELGHFFGNVVGLTAGLPTHEGARTWRNDEAAHRVIVAEGPSNDATFIGLEYSSDGELDTAVARLGALGRTVLDATDTLGAARRSDRVFTMNSPFGPTVELTTGLQRSTDPLDSSLIASGFLTNGVGFGHVVFATTAFDDTHDLLTQGLAFEQSDWLEMELAPGIALEVRFYHCNPRHHTIAIAKAPFELPQRLHHIMFETNSVDDVGRAFDRAWDSGLPIPNGLGRHDNDRMFSFYVASPSGFQVEIGHGARIVGSDWDDNRRYEHISSWGHQPLRG